MSTPMKYRHLTSLLLLLLLLSCFGCRLGPEYQSPEIETPEAWKNDSTPCVESPSFSGRWWEVFDDATLNCLEEQALVYNPNLAAALDRVAQARAIAGVDKAALYPQASLNPGYTDTGTLFKIYLPPGGLGIPGIGTPLKTPYRIHEYQLTMPLMMSYEIDLWGKLRGEYDSAVYNAQAQMENYRTVMLTLTADLASSYFQLRSLDAQIESLKMNVEYLRKNSTLVQSRFDKGLVNVIDVVSATQELSTTEALYYDAMRQRSLQEDLIATLAGTPASEFFLESMPLMNPPPVIPSGVPAEILLQRPDIAAAERTMRSEHALIGVAYASFFPSIQLTGGLGYSSPTLHDFLKWKSRLWNFAANAAQVVFDGGRIFSNVQLAYAHFHEASHQYQQTVLVAFQEVEDSLTNLKFQALEYESYARAYTASSKRVELANRRYLQGIANYLEVVDSERTGIQVELSLAITLGSQYLSTIQLIKALGGSWD